MGVNFSPFEIGRRALRASQYGLEITGQNIANVNTPGYSRQKLQLSASPGDTTTLNSVGTGVSIDGIRTFRDSFIESRLQTETGITGRLTAKRDALTPVDALFNETNGGGISSAMNEFFGAFRDLEANPNSTVLRNVVVDKAAALSTAFNSTGARLEQIRQDTDTSARLTMDEANVLAGRIADLNGKIGVAEHTTGNASELRDQRAEYVRQLTGLTGARTSEDSNGALTVTLGDGQALVSGTHVVPLQATATPPDGHTSISLNGQPAAFADGKIRGLFEALDQINKQADNLDQLAGVIAGRVDQLHSSGTDQDNNPGGNFFEVPAGGAPVTARNIAVSSAVQANPRLIVASPLPPPGAGTVAGAIANLLSDTTSVVGGQTGTFGSIFASFVSDAGSGVRSAADALTTQQAILDQTTAQRDAVSGVSLDEEAVSLLQYQRSYEAAARFLNIADQMTQTILALGQ
jgi:flagellar hook-associated protein 1 FlgK